MANANIAKGMPSIRGSLSGATGVIIDAIAFALLV
jgi:hypothetical protein